MALSGRIAVVTGAAMGIGRAAAVRLAADGADVAVMDKADAELKETARLIEAQGRRCLAIEVDLLDREATRAAFSRAKEVLGSVDILHNNVGQSARERSLPFWDSDPEVWDFVLDLNLRTTLFCSRQVVNDMRDRKYGRIICTSSEASYSGQRGTTDYSAAKAGIQGFVRSLAFELAPFGVTVNAVLPGLTRTRALDLLPTELLEPVIRTIPMGHLCEPEDIAHAVSFFASDGARYVTGASLLVNGGRVMI